MSSLQTRVIGAKETASMDGNQFAYRSISKSAVACIVFSVLGIVAFLAQPFVILPALGLGFGMVAWSGFRRFPDELVGLLPVKLCVIASSLILVSSVIFHSYVYATEVPDGYTRIAFSDLRPNQRTPIPFSEKAAELDGKKVFLKGYVRPGAKRINLKDFILVGDFGDCCFGGNPKITEVVAVNIHSDDTVDHSLSLRRIGGTFRLNRSTRSTDEEDIPQVYYEIEADYIR